MDFWRVLNPPSVNVRRCGRFFFMIDTAWCFESSLLRWFPLPIGRLVMTFSFSRLFGALATGPAQFLSGSFPLSRLLGPVGLWRFSDPPQVQAGHLLPAVFHPFSSSFLKSTHPVPVSRGDPSLNFHAISPFFFPFLGGSRAEADCKPGFSGDLFLP